MKHIKFDQQKVVAELQTVVAAKGPDYVYPRAGNGETGANCVYFEPDGQPSCIVGHVLAIEGVTIDDLELDEYSTANEETSVRGLVDVGMIEADPTALNILLDVQSLQDRGVPWGKALEVAIARAEERAQGRTTPNASATPLETVLAVLDD